jgi:ribosomal protein L29
MTKKDIMKIKTDQELMKILSDTREILRTERFSAAGARAKNPNHLGQMRKIVARVLTEQTSRTKAVK